MNLSVDRIVLAISESKSYISRRQVWLMIIATTGFAVQVNAAVVPYTETFAADAANWYNPPSTTTLDWLNSGGVGGGAYASTGFSFVGNAIDDTPVLFRAQDEYGSSGGAFNGNWIAEGVTQFSAMVRHNAGQPLTFFSRFSGPGNFPGATAIQFAPVPGNAWVPVSFLIDPFSPQFISFEGTDFDSVFSNIGHIQVGVSVPAGLAGVDSEFTFDIDNASIVPEPATIGLLAIGMMGLAGCRRARAGRA